MSTQQDIDASGAQRLANTHDPLTFMENTQTPFHPDQSSLITHIQHPPPNNYFVPRPSFNTNYMQQPMQNPGIQIARNMNGLSVVSETVDQYVNGNVVTTPTEGNGNGIIVNPIRCYNCQGEGHYASNCTVKPRKRDAAYLQQQLSIAQEQEAGIQSTQEESNFMATVGACEETERANANCTVENNLQQASTSGTQTDKAPVYDSDRSAEVQLHDNGYNNEIFNMFIQEEQYIELLEPIPEPHQVPQNDSNVISEVPNVEHAAEVEKVNPVNRKMKEKIAELTIELARYKNQERCFEISQEKYDKLERCYQQSVYQEQCLSKKINALHLSSGKQITALNEEISNLNKQLSKEKSTVSSLQKEKKRLKSDFKIREDELLDKQIQLENKVKELDNILFKTAQQKQQSLYIGKVLLEKHDPPAMYDSKETLELA
ncbi:retrovirus-related pol polyprotein from transposon TNT 1-94 [Tanacetum coccineum]